MATPTAALTLSTSNTWTNGAGTFPQPVPSAPTGLSAVAISSTQINLGLGSAPIAATQTEWSYKANASSTWIVLSTTPPAIVALQVSGLTVATAYDFRVRYNGLNGYSAYSATVTTSTVVAPSVPVLNPVTVVSSTALTVTLASFPANAMTVTLQRDTNAAFTSPTSFTLNSPNTSYADTGLTASTTYYYRAASTGAGGTSGYSSIVSATTSSINVTDLTQIFRSINYDARTNGTTPSDTGVTYWDSTTVNGSNLWFGHKSVRHVLANSGGHGPYGDEWAYSNFPANPNFANGDEMWVVRTLYVDPTFDYTAASNLKWLRAANIRQSDGVTNVGWLDFYITDNTGSMKHQNELASVADNFSSQSNAALAALNYKFPKGQWVAFQVYIKFSTTAGIVRAWADNTPIYENTTLKTMNSATDKVVATYWQNYWNGAGLPAGNVGLGMESSVAALAIHTAGRDDTSQLPLDSRGNRYVKTV